MMDCPVCSKEYPLSEIEEHVEKCLSMGINDDDNNAKSPQTKRTFPFEDRGKDPPQKKPKIHDSSHSTGKDFLSNQNDNCNYMKNQDGQNKGWMQPANVNKNSNPSNNTLENQGEQKKSRMAFANGHKNSNASKNTLGNQGEHNKNTIFSNTKKNVNPSKNNFGDLGGQKKGDHVPLAEKLRPSSLSTYVGQKNLLGPQTVLHKLLDNREIPSMILWGPPGCGKTSLANIIAKMTKENSQGKTRFVKLSATSSGIADIREAVSSAAKELKLGCQTIVFMDEIHRFNKLQQDIFLPHVEAGTFVLIGATTENPSFSLNSALLSRCRVFVLEKLTKTDILHIIEKGVRSLGGDLGRAKKLSQQSDTESVDPKFLIDEDAAQWLAEACDGDARVALGGLEIAVKARNPTSNQYSKHTKNWRLSIKDLKDGLEKIHTLSERKCDLNYDLIFAMQKSVRAGNANATLYWLARLMAGGEDPVYIARRLIRVASEDVGLDDPEALDIAVHTMHACQMIGMPECDVMLGQCAIYLARASKSRLVDDALRKAQRTVMEHKGPQPSVPLHIRDRGGERKLQASLGAGRVNLVRQKEQGRNRLPAGLENADFFN